MTTGLIQNGDYEIEDDGTDLLIKDPNGDTVLQWDETAGKWTLPANAPFDVSELIDGAGVSHTSELADDGDAQPPETHSGTHEDGSSDEISVTGLSGDLADPQDPKSHSGTHESGGSDAIGTGTLNPQDPTNHATDHEQGGSDELQVEALATASTADGEFFSPDGNGGVEVQASGGKTNDEIQEQALAVDIVTGGAL